jgi:microtubule-associated protein-like 6
MQVWWGKFFGSSVDDLKYSPCGQFLAAGTHDQVLGVFDVAAGYKLLHKCKGHTSAVKHIDWAADSSAVQSTDQAYEVRLGPRIGRGIRQSWPY